MLWGLSNRFLWALLLASVLILQIVTFTTIPAAAQTAANGTLGARITEHPYPDLVFNAVGDGTFSINILNDGSIQGRGEITEKVTISGRCSAQWTQSGTLGISGKADVSSKRLTLVFSGDTASVKSYQCGDRVEYVTGPTYRWNGNVVNLVMENGARFEDPHDDPCYTGDTCIIWVEIVNISGTGGAPAGPFDFSISVMDTTLTVSRGNSVVTTVTVYLEKGTAQPVTLKVGTTHTELLKTVKVSLSKSTGNPNFSSKLTIIASPDTPQGTFSIAVVGEGSGITRSKQLTLVIGEGKPSLYPTPSPTPTEKPDFTVSVLPTSSIEVSEGESAAWTIKINWRTSPERIHLEVKSDPQLMPWHKITLQPKDIQEIKEGTATLTIQTNRNPTKGFAKELEEYKLTITAKTVYSGVTRSGTVDLKVLPAPKPSPEVPPPPPPPSNEPPFDLKADYCGGSGISKYVPDFDIKQACYQHDLCYGKGGTADDRKRCDIDFYNAIKHKGGFGHALLAWTYYYGVRTFGPAFFTYTILPEFLCQFVSFDRCDATVVRGEIHVPLKSDLQILPGDTIKTGDDTVKIRGIISKDGTVQLWKNTVATFVGVEQPTTKTGTKVYEPSPQDPFRLPSDSNPGSPWLFLRQGSGYFKDYRGSMVTPSAYISDLRTEFTVDVDDQGTRVTVFDGTVEALDPEGKITSVNANQQLIIPVGHELKPFIKAFDPDSTDKWWLQSSLAETKTTVDVAIKHKKKVTLLAVKNNGDEEIFGIQIKIDDGKITFVKARGWDRERIDEGTIILQTSDRPIMPGKSLIMMLVIDNPASSFEWTAFDSSSNMIAKGDVILK